MEVLDFTTDPKSIAQGAYDGIWVELKERRSPSPLEARTLQWLDWKLQGQLSRLLLDESRLSDEPMFVPTMRKLPAQYIVLVRKVDLKRLRESCKGLGLKKVLLFCEEPSRQAALRKELDAKPGEWPQSLDFGIERPVEGVS
jgi:hypothetical protein